jgi:hypothetical protein
MKRPIFLFATVLSILGCGSIDTLAADDTPVSFKDVVGDYYFGDGTASLRSGRLFHPVFMNRRSNQLAAAVLGEPDFLGSSHKRQSPAIWRYEEVEFHFSPKPTEALSLIWLEDKTGMVGPASGCYHEFIC